MVEYSEDQNAYVESKSARKLTPKKARARSSFTLLSNELSFFSICFHVSCVILNLYPGFFAVQVNGVNNYEQA